MAVPQFNMEVLCFAAGAAVGAFAVWIAWNRCRSCPQLDAVKDLNAKLKLKTDAYRTLCRDSLNGLELLASHAALIQANHPSTAADKFMDAVGSLRAMLIDRQAGSKDMTPYQELVQIKGHHG